MALRKVRRDGGIDDYLEDRRRQLQRAGEFTRRFGATGPQGEPLKRSTGNVKRLSTRGKYDSGIRINPKNVSVTRTGLSRRDRTNSQRSTRGYGGRSR